MLQGEHSAILLTFVKLPFVFKTFVLSIFEWPLKIGFSEFKNYQNLIHWPFCLKLSSAAIIGGVLILKRSGYRKEEHTVMVKCI